MSEGAADFLAASITGDSRHGPRLLLHRHAAARPRSRWSEWQWPKDIGEIHHTGMIFGGTFWDLRKALIAAYGETEGVALTVKIYLGTLRRAIEHPVDACSRRSSRTTTTAT